MPSPAYRLGACVFSPAGLFTTNKWSSSKITHGSTGKYNHNTSARRSRNQTPRADALRKTLAACGNPDRKSAVARGSPEIPCTFPNYPKAEQEVGDGMGGHGVAQALLPDDQPLKSQPAENARQPAVRMHQPEHR